ncbi:MAG: type 1 glutamine amidotransferase [Pseudomonadota bacterium]
MRILVVEGNGPREIAALAEIGARPPAEAYGAVLARHAPGLRLAYTRPLEQAEPVLDGIDAVALTGSGVPWSADAPQARPHRRVVERAFAAGLPVFGSCWGLQVPAVVLGGAVGAAPSGVEVPLARNIALTDAGRRHPMHAARPAVFDAPCIHRDIVTRVPEGAVVTASNAHSAVQAMVYERPDARFWGVQYHPEMQLAEVLALVAMPGGAAVFGAEVEPAGTPRRYADEAPADGTEQAAWLAALSAGGAVGHTGP